MSLFLQKPQESITQPIPVPAEETTKYVHLAEEVGRTHRYGGIVVYKLKEGERILYFTSQGGMVIVP